MYHRKANTDVTYGKVFSRVRAYMDSERFFYPAPTAPTTLRSSVVGAVGAGCFFVSQPYARTREQPRPPMTFRNKILMLMIKILMVKKLFLTIRILLSNVVTFSNHANVPLCINRTPRPI